MKKYRKKKKKLLGMGRHAAMPPQKNTRSRVALLFPAVACGAMRTGGGVISSPAWPGRCKGEEGGGGRRLLSLSARGAQEEENLKNTDT